MCMCINALFGLDILASLPNISNANIAISPMGPMNYTRQNRSKKKRGKKKHADVAGRDSRLNIIG